MNKDYNLEKTIWSLILIGVMSLFFTGCIVYDGTYQTTSSSYYDDYDRTPDYWSINYAPSMWMYYYGSNIYWGYSNGYYYYYGYQHMYPWHYYYQYQPPHHYTSHTHVTCYIGHRGYINRPHRTKRHNNRSGGSYNVNHVNSNGVTVKTNTYRPTIKTNTTRVKTAPIRTTRVKTNTIYRPNIKTNTIRTNTNRSNTTIRVKTNTNRKTIRPKTNHRSPR